MDGPGIPGVVASGCAAEDPLLISTLRALIRKQAGDLASPSKTAANSLLEPRKVIRRRGQERPALVDGQAALNRFPAAEPEFLLPALVQPGGFRRGRFKGFRVRSVAEENLCRLVLRRAECQRSAPFAERENLLLGLKVAKL